MKTRIFFVSLVLALGSVTARAADLTWNGSISTDWNNPTNWTPEQIPIASDHVIINSGSVTIPETGTFAVMDWTGGSISGSLTVASNGVLNVGGSGQKDLYGPLTNAGSVVWTGSGSLIVRYYPAISWYGAIYNLPGALFDIQTDASLSYYTGNEVFNNAGTLRKSAGSGITYFYPQLVNTGNVEVQSGTLAFANGGIIDGPFQAAVGTVISFSGNFTNGTAPLLNGLGTYQFTSGTLTLLTSDLIPNLQLLGGTLLVGPSFQGGTITNLTLNGMTLGGTNTVTGVATLGGGFSGALTVASNAVVNELAGSSSGPLTVAGGATVNFTGGSISSGPVTVAGGAIFNWSGGYIGGSLTVASNGVLNVSGSGQKDLYGPLTNAGSVVWTGSGQWVLHYYPAISWYGAIYNLAGALFDIQTDASLSYYTGNEVFNNAGTLRKSAGSGTTYFYPQLVNTGNVEVQSGTLAFANGGIIDGPFQAAVGTVISFSGNFTNGTAPLLNGLGTYQFTSGTLTLLTSDLIPNLQLLGGTLLVGPSFQGGTITNLTLTGMTLGGTNTVTGVATLGGGFSGALTVASNAVVNELAGSSSGPLTVAGGATVNFTGGSISSGPVTVAGGAIFNWSGGYIGGSLTVASNGVLNVSGSGQKDLYGPLTNAGSVVWTGSGQWVLHYYPAISWYGAIYNLAGALFDIQTDASLSYYTGNEVFNNAGTLRKSAGSGTTYFYPQLVNTGNVEVQSGTLAFANGGIIDGPFQAAVGTVISFSGNFTNGTAPLLNGLGTYQFTSGTLTLLSSDLIPNLQLLGGTLLVGPSFQGGTITNLTLNGMTLGGTNTVTGVATLGGGFSGALTVASNAVVNELAGSSSGPLTVVGGATVNFTGGSINYGPVTVAGGALFNWTGGYIGVSGSLMVMSNAVLNVGGSGQKDLYGPLTNAGSVVWTGSGQWVLHYYPANSWYGAIYNLPGALFDIQTDAPLSYHSGNEMFDNAGTLRKSAGSGTTSFYPQLVNTGNVEVQSGTLALYNGGSLGGQFTTASGAVLDLASGNFSELGTPVFGGGGQSRFTGGTITLLDNLLANLAMLGGGLVPGPAFQGGTITNLTLTGTMLMGTNIVTGTATLGGGFSGALTVASNAVVNGLNGSSSGPLTVAGGATVNFTGGSISSGPVTVAGGALFNWTGGYIGVSGSLMVMSNAVLNVGGSGQKDLYGPLTNAGSVVWTGSGQWVLHYYPANSWYGAIYNLPGALFDIQTDAPLSYHSGNEMFDNAGTLRKSAGSGTTYFYPQLNNSGTVTAWQGVLSLLGNFSDGPSASLSISLGGPQAGTDYGRISFSTPLSSAGNLSVSARNGYLPNPGDAFLVLTYPPSTNFFACISGLDLGNGILLQPQFTSTSLTLLAVAYTINSAQPELFIGRTIGGVLISWPPGFPGWTLQSTTNLLPANWTPVSNTCNNQANVPVSAPQQYFRLSQ